MLTEDYVSLKTAKLLKEKGFNISCDSYYAWYESDITLYTGYVCDFSDNPFNYNNCNDKISRPSQSLALKWLREIHGIEIIIDVCKCGEECKTMYTWTPVIVKKRNLEFPISQANGSIFGGLCEMYKESVEKGIIYSLENLI